jgi:hypothetical protein
MFILDGRPLAPDTAFTATNSDGELVQFPPNWLRLASPEEREAIGITEVPDPAPYDQRFYWGYDADGALIPKDHTQLVKQWVAQTKATAFSLMQPTDWYFTREQDNGTPAPLDVRALREEIRQDSRQKVAAIEATADTKALAAYCTSAEYNQWPPYPVVEPSATPVAAAA